MSNCSKHDYSSFSPDPCPVCKSEEGLKNLWGNIAERCMIEEFFKKEAAKPINIRKSYCHISCPCSRCRPMM